MILFLSTRFKKEAFMSRVNNRGEDRRKKINDKNI